MDGLHFHCSPMVGSKWINEMSCLLYLERAAMYKCLLHKREAYTHSQCTFASTTNVKGKLTCHPYSYIAFAFWCIVYAGGTPRSHEHETVAVELFITYSILSGMGIVFAVICLVFNLVFRKKMWVAAKLVTNIQEYNNATWPIGLTRTCYNLTCTYLHISWIQ